MALPAKDAPASVWESFFQKNFRELAPEHLKGSRPAREGVQREVQKSGHGPRHATASRGSSTGTVSTCPGASAAAGASTPASTENNPSRDPQIHWIRVLQLNKERGVDLEDAEQYYNPSKVPEKGHFYMPVQCQQCEHPPA